MHRIDTPTAQKDKFGAGKNGFTRGNPQTGTPSTDLDDDYFDALQEEIVGVIEAAAIQLDKSDRGQLLKSLKKHFQASDATLTALAGLATSENKIPYFIGADRAALADFSKVGRDIAGAGTVNDVLQYLGLGDAAKRNVGTTSGTVAAGDATMGGTYTIVTSSRVMGVTYTNSATRPMLVIYSCDATSFGTAVAAVNGVNVARVIGVESSATHNGPSMTFIVPAGATYSITKTAGSLSNMIWAEMV
ncbi:hypothetical protein [Edwardsiella anguillarum]|uniref:Phage tail fiber protein n=3 Tax=Edwardsiella anguillarum TaxID=1821960 RepID=A0A076LGS0_9GAMM|nr:hypothetical protein [Edwardsiella anguillarum]AIJ07301.1 Phage tail fiber protein [Edwardsiella anguillarum ET080813]KAB0590863.1 hypothetical protein F7P84_10490 [Edwardsiella anguillarum]UOU78402.1 hypothetical protein MUN71_15370 [Edwardsiella anguillarum]